MLKFAPFYLGTKPFCRSFALDCSIPWQPPRSISSSPSSASSSASWSQFPLSSRGGWSPGRSRVTSTLPSRRRTSPSAPPSTSTLSSPWPRPTPPCSSSTASPASSPSSLASIILSDGPVYELKDYIESTQHKGIRAPSINSPLPSPLRATLRALLQAAIVSQVCTD